MTPIPKKGKDPRIPLNNRTISLISTIAKIFSNILNNRIMNYLENNNLLVDEQNGFRRLRSCLDHLFILTTIVLHRRKRNLPTYACYVDFSKVFDGINHDCLWHKLSEFGIQGKLYNIIKTLYKEIQSSVQVAGYLTDWFSVTSGVRQGDNIAPTLFAMYINSLAQEIKNLNKGVNVDELMVSILLYADDIVLISDSEKGLQEQLNTMHKWCHKWRMKVNMEKTKIMHFRSSSQSETTHQFKFGESLIETTEIYRYLGFDIHYTMKYDQGVNTLADAAGRASGSLITKYFKCGGLTYDTYSKLYNSSIVPISDYAAGIWGTKSYNKCNVLQHRMMRTFLGVGKMTPIPFLYGEMAWLTPSIRQQAEVVRLWTRLITMNEDRLTKKIFKWDYNLCQNRHYSWNSHVKHIFTVASMDDIFNNCSLLGRSKRTIIDGLTKQLWLQYENEWKQTITEMARLENYSNYKRNIKVEEYISSKVIQRSDRQNIAKLRSGTLPIEIERGRYRSKPREERLCQQCNLNVVESETHFLIQCPHNHEKTQKFMDEIVNILQIEDQSQITLEMLSNEVKCVRKVSQHIQTLLSSRV